MKTRMKEHVLASRKEKGAAMVVGLLMITVLSIVGVNGAKENVVQQRMANNYRFAIEAMNNAEAGITSAISQLNNNELGKNGFDDELDPNGDGDTSDALVITLNDPNSNMSYVVLLVDDDDGDGNLAVDSNNIIRLVSQGISDIGSTRTLDVRIEANLGAGPGVSIEKAILAAESITFSGNSTYCGSNQDIHSNENVYQTDHPTTSGVISASGTAYGGDPMGGGTVQSNADVAEIPRIDPSDFEEYADYIFKSNGKIYNADGVMVGTNEYGNWKFGGDKWTTEGDDNVLGGMLYFQGEYGNVNVGSNPGTGADPWVVSILADGYIEISGNPTIDNHMDPDDPPSVQAILFMSGTDVKINGNPGQTFTGLIAAHEQFSVSGNPELQAAIIAEGAASTSDLVVQNEVSGDMSLCYDGDFTIPGSENTGDGTARIISWRDVELARGAGVFANTQQRYDY
jgi:Tfp pilus assembly protein PilX